MYCLWIEASVALRPLFLPRAHHPTWLWSAQHSPEVTTDPHEIGVVFSIMVRMAMVSVSSKRTTDEIVLPPALIPEGFPITLTLALLTVGHRPYVICPFLNFRM